MPDVTHVTVIRTDEDKSELRMTGTGYAIRCASAVADRNWPDARWALKVLNRYGHLVCHEADFVRPGDAAFVWPDPPIDDERAQFFHDLYRDEERTP